MPANIFEIHGGKVSPLHFLLYSKPMLPEADLIIHSENREETRRFFAVQNVDGDRLRALARRTLGIYASATGRDFSGSDLRDYPGLILSRLRERRDFGLSFGMPKLDTKTQRNGKLWVMAPTLYLPEGHIKAVGFRIDTNDYSAATPQPPESSQVEADFNAGMCELADTEFEDIAVPVSPQDFVKPGYNPRNTPSVG